MVSCRLKILRAKAEDKPEDEQKWIHCKYNEVQIDPIFSNSINKSAEPQVTRGVTKLVSAQKQSI